MRKTRIALDEADALRKNDPQQYIRRLRQAIF